MSYPRRSRTKETEVAEDKPDFRSLSYNRRVKQSKEGAALNPFVPANKLRTRADDYFDTTEYPTFTGLALALGFPSVKQWEQAMADHALIIAKHGEKVKREHADRLFVWEVARSRVQMHYEEGIQSQTIPAQVGKFVLEVLGFQPAQVVEQKVAGAMAAADATRAGFAQASAEFARAGKQGKGLANDVNSSLQ